MEKVLRFNRCSNNQAGPGSKAVNYSINCLTTDLRDVPFGPNAIEASGTCTPNSVSACLFGLPTLMAVARDVSNEVIASVSPAFIWDINYGHE